MCSPEISRVSALTPNLATLLPLLSCNRLLWIPKSSPFLIWIMPVAVASRTTFTGQESWHHGFAGTTEKRHSHGNIGRLKLPSQGAFREAGGHFSQKQEVCEVELKLETRHALWERKAQDSMLFVTLPYTCPVSHERCPPERTHAAFPSAEGRPEPDTRISWACTVCQTLPGASLLCHFHPPNAGREATSCPFHAHGNEDPERLRESPGLTQQESQIGSSSQGRGSPAEPPPLKPVPSRAASPQSYGRPAPRECGGLWRRAP